MKLLMFYATRFKFNPISRASDSFADEPNSGEVENAILGFIHVEKEDEERVSEATTRLIKNLKWLAGKNNTKTIVLHSFSHLSESKSDAKTVSTIFVNAKARLENVGYTIIQTPLGYICDIELHAPGSSLARVFKDI